MSASFDAYLDLSAVSASQQSAPFSAMYVHDFYDGIESGVVATTDGEYYRVESPDESRSRHFRLFILGKLPSDWSNILPNPLGLPKFEWIDPALFDQVRAERTSEHYCCIGHPHLYWFVATRLPEIPISLDFKSAHALLRSKFRSSGDGYGGRCKNP